MNAPASIAATTVGEIACSLGVELLGDPTVVVERISSISDASAGSITFVTGRKFLDELRDLEASAVIVPATLANETSVARLVSDDPYLTYARLTAMLRLTPEAKNGVHASATVSDSASVSEGARVEANCTIEQGAQIGAGSTVCAGCYVGRDTIVGENSILYPNVTVMHGCVIGDDCEIHPGAVIGADGFGWAPNGASWEKIHQLGGVRLGNRVSVGANTTIDRGALGDTVLHDGVILDNQIQIAHNVRIGENTAIAGCVGVAGSTTIGKNCRIAGKVAIVGHITICDNVFVSAQSFVNKSVNSPGSYSSGIPLQDSASWRKNAVRLKNLDRIARKVKQLET